MTSPTPTSPVHPVRIASPSGLSVEWNANGSIRRMDHGDIMLNLFLGNEADGGLANIHLRRHGDPVETTPLLGPVSPASYEADARGFTARGRWRDIRFQVRLVLADGVPGWFWHVELENVGKSSVTCDLIHTQDIGLAHYGAIRLNEFYVSQYVDHSPLEHSKLGVAVASRQNQSMGGRCPWTVTGSLGRGTAYATDALQFHGLVTRAGGTPPALSAGLPGKRLQHEHSMVAIQDAPLVLKPGEKKRSGFFGWFVVNKSEATSQEDVAVIDAALALAEAAFPLQSKSTPDAAKRAAGLFASAPLLESLTLDAGMTARLFGNEPRHVEESDQGVLSFFTANRTHVVLKAKELAVLRPHGHLLRTGSSLVPDETALTSTAWMNGVFHSMVTQGHVSINRFLSTCHTYLGLFRSHGQRVFVELEGRWHLLGVPSAFEMALDSCRWIYRHRGGVIEVVSTAPDHTHELLLTLTVLEGPPCRFLISHHVAMNGDDGSQAIPLRKEVRGRGTFVRAIPDSDVGSRFPDGGFFVSPSGDTVVEMTGGDELLFEDGVSRNQPFLCLITSPSRAASLVIEGHLLDAKAATLKAGFWDSLTAGVRVEVPGACPLGAAAARTADILPWYIHNALVHYLSPRGLEQYSGGGWGTRDVCQGPVELLLALGRLEPIRDLLCRVFRQQNGDGDWPQWFMFFDRERQIRPGDSHGDIVYWPLVALAEYLTATGDAGLLDERLPFFHGGGDAAAERGTVWQHVERALGLIRRRVIAGTHLAAYGHGDWNDSLQPARAEMRERLCSSWTVTLNYQTCTALAGALRHVGQHERAGEMQAMADVVLEEFQRILIVDGVIAGFAYFHEGGNTDFLLHPGDKITGLSYSVLPMVHAIINDMLTPEQAEAHLALIRKHLLGPDGARLFDRPLAYHGGPQKYFQRAESASFFGREIGIMYTHAHLRYCEALARHGDAEAFFVALGQAIPIGVQEFVPTATLRQANCYFSSSDAAFADRYEAFDSYDRVKRGEVPLEGGWRVYSSGAGIAVRLVWQCFLGIRIESASVVIDPVIPVILDGLIADLPLEGRKLEVTYRVTRTGSGPVSITLNGEALPFTRVENRYRTGGARIVREDFAKRLQDDLNQLVVTLS